MKQQISIMKKLLFLIVICFATIAQLYAQGIIINKTDGTKVYFPADQVASISTYGYGEGPQTIEYDTQTFTANGVSFAMVAVEGGVFQMGSDDSDAYVRGEPVHQVKLSSYSIGQTEVTQELWEAVMGSNPSNFKGLKRPIEKVSWNDCQTFITKLNALTGQHFRLPTEAEWEFAARGGVKSQGYKYAGSNTIDDVAWYTVNSYDVGSSDPNYGTHEVGTKQPNELGIYDMSGNVYEWCQDWYSSTYYFSSVINNPAGPDTGSGRVTRGGSWRPDARDCCVARRGFFTPTSTRNNLGLRLAL